MKVLIISGSERKNGITFSVAEKMVRMFNNADCKAEVIHLSIDDRGFNLWSAFLLFVRNNLLFAEAHRVPLCQRRAAIGQAIVKW
ncbi:NAD(P)H-dependent oxidoreductase [Pantoea sp. FN060301]|uniref:NAD(P)H-dependent oxidoreductase n=1 Tax=Pantoea sp. FN060301 TaxID=3420380 RepID=UPI003D170E9F